MGFVSYLSFGNDLVRGQMQAVTQPTAPTSCKKAPPSRCDRGAFLFQQYVLGLTHAAAFVGRAIQAVTKSCPLPRWWSEIAIECRKGPRLRKPLIANRRGPRVPDGKNPSASGSLTFCQVLPESNDATSPCLCNEARRALPAPAASWNCNSRMSARVQLRPASREEYKPDMLEVMKKVLVVDTAGEDCQRPRK